MSKKPSSHRKGRGLELFVKRIKEHQSPEAKISSPEFVPDVDTGQPREVDIGLRVPRNGGSVFISIECRDRVTDQGVEWVEQLICKKQSICADVLVAVTSSRFSKPARIKALKHGVMLARMSTKLPEELGELATSIFVTLRYLAPRILSVHLQVPDRLAKDLESYRYCHHSIDQELSLFELAQVWTTPNLVRTIPRFVEDCSKTNFAKLELGEIDADILFNDKRYPIHGAKIVYELNYGEMELPLRAVQELAILDGVLDMDARAFMFGADIGSQSEVIVDAQTGTLRWDIFGKSILSQGKVLIGARLKASKPVSITTMSLDL